MTKPKTGLTAKFFRARLFEKNRSRFVWDFASFLPLNEFYNSVKGKKVKRDYLIIRFYLCGVCGDEVELEAINISDTKEDIQSLIEYDHPHREVKRLC